MVHLDRVRVDVPGIVEHGVVAQHQGGHAQLGEGRQIALQPHAEAVGVLVDGAEHHAVFTVKAAVDQHVAVAPLDTGHGDRLAGHHQGVARGQGVHVHDVVDVHREDVHRVHVDAGCAAEYIAAVEGDGILAVRQRVDVQFDGLGRHGLGRGRGAVVKFDGVAQPDIAGLIVHGEAREVQVALAPVGVDAEGAGDAVAAVLLHGVAVQLHHQIVRLEVGGVAEGQQQRREVGFRVAHVGQGPAVGLYAGVVRIARGGDGQGQVDGAGGVALALPLVGGDGLQPFVDHRVHVGGADLAILDHQLVLSGEGGQRGVQLLSINAVHAAGVVAQRVQQLLHGANVVAPAAAFEGCAGLDDLGLFKAAALADAPALAGLGAGHFLHGLPGAEIVLQVLQGLGPADAVRVKVAVLLVLDQRLFGAAAEDAVDAICVQVALLHQQLLHPAHFGALVAAAQRALGVEGLLAAVVAADLADLRPGAGGMVGGLHDDLPLIIVGQLVQCLGAHLAAHLAFALPLALLGAGGLLGHAPAAPGVLGVVLLRFPLAADLAGAGAGALDDAGGLLGHLPLVPAVALGLDGLRLRLAADPAGALALALLGAGGLLGHLPLAPFVAAVFLGHLLAQVLRLDEAQHLAAVLGVLDQGLRPLAVGGDVVHVHGPAALVFLDDLGVCVVLLVDVDRTPVDIHRAVIGRQRAIRQRDHQHQCQE